MSYLAGGVVIATTLTVLNLLLTLGVVRRLREHTELLATRPATGVADIMVRTGESPAGFHAVTTDGERISRDGLLGEQLVGFFSPGCEPCREKVPRFAELAATRRRSQVLAVVVGGAEEAPDFVAILEPVARVVVESGPDTGSVAQAFRVTGFPAICLMDGDGVVTASGLEDIRPAESSPAP